MHHKEAVNVPVASLADKLRAEVTEADQIASDVEYIHMALFGGGEAKPDIPRSDYIEGMVSDLSAEHCRARALLSEIRARLESRAGPIHGQTASEADFDFGLARAP